MMGMEPMGLAKVNRELLWIDPNDYMSELSDACFHLDNFGMNVSVYNLPLCVLPKELWRFARKSISDWKNVYAGFCNDCLYAETAADFSPRRAKDGVAVRDIQSSPMKPSPQRSDGQSPTQILEQALRCSGGYCANDDCGKRLVTRRSGYGDCSGQLRSYSGAPNFLGSHIVRKVSSALRLTEVTQAIEVTVVIEAIIPRLEVVGTIERRLPPPPLRRRSILPYLRVLPWSQRLYSPRSKSLPGRSFKRS